MSLLSGMPQRDRRSWARKGKPGPVLQVSLAGILLGGVVLSRLAGVVHVVAGISSLESIAVAAKSCLGAAAGSGLPSAKRQLFSLGPPSAQTARAKYRGRVASAATGAAASSESLEDVKAREQDLLRQLDALREDKSRLVASRRLRIGIVGFGTFGRFLAKTFVKHHDVVVTSRSPYSAEAADLGVSYWPMSEVDKFFEERLDVCVLAVSIVSFESIIELLAPHMAGRELLVVDVLSVKAYPRELLLRHVPADCDLLSTHPMFGPDSGGGPTGWAGLNFVYEPVRITEHPARRDLLEHFLSIWEREGCQMVQMTCDEHDQYAANSQFVTHMVGRILGDQRLTPTPIDTKGFQSLLRVVDNTNSDSFALFYGLYRYNNNSRATINALRCSLDRIVVSLEQASADQ